MKKNKLWMLSILLAGCLTACAGSAKPTNYSALHEDANEHLSMSSRKDLPASSKPVLNNKKSSDPVVDKNLVLSKVNKPRDIITDPARGKIKIDDTATSISALKQGVILGPTVKPIEFGIGKSLVDLNEPPNLDVFITFDPVTGKKIINSDPNNPILKPYHPDLPIISSTSSSTQKPFNHIFEYINDYVEFPPPIPIAYDVDPGDNLYEIYRRGLITRHICSNGRVDESSWLRETLKPELAARHRVERYKTVKGGDEISTREFLWSTLTRTHENGTVIHWGGGENPLLTGGLALAAFSLEGLHVRSDTGPQSYSKHSLVYAHKIVNFILQSKFGRGVYARQDSTISKPEKKPMMASTDELLGISIGFLYYERLLSQLKTAGRLHGLYKDDLLAVQQSIKEIASTLAAHGGWYLPYANELNTNITLSMGRQTAWIFSYPMSLWFHKMNAPVVNLQWDKVEYAQYISKYAFDAYGNKVLGEIIAIKDVSQAFSSRDQFILLCKVVQTIFGQLPHEGKIFDTESFVLVHVREGLRTPGKKLAQFFYDTLADDRTANFYNMHMFALSSILALESNPDPELRRAIGETFYALLRGRSGFHPGSGNALFALVASMAEPEWAYSQEVIAALYPLTSGCKTGEVYSGFQHDLPLGTIEWFPKIQSPYPVYPPAESGDPEHETINRTSHVAKPPTFFDPELHVSINISNYKWHETFKGWDLPYNYNPDDRWGRSRVYSNSYEKHARIKTVSLSDVEEESVMKALFSDTGIQPRKLAIAVESAEVDFLFTRMLLATMAERIDITYWKKFQLQRLSDERDFQYPVLKVPGAWPVIP